MNRIFTFCFTLFYTTFLTAQTEPTSQPTSLVFTNVKAWMASMSFNSNGSDGYLILRSDAPISDSPNDGVAYQKGQWIGNSKVISTNSLSFITVRELRESSTYYFAIFAYNGSGATSNYKTDNPLSGILNSAVADPGNYYQNIDGQSPGFMDDLTTLIQNHTFLSYDDFKTTVVPNIYERDTTNGQKTIQCQYSGEIKVYAPPFAWAATNTSREHRLPQSWMKVGGNTSSPPGTDYHNLELVNNNQVNVVRSNYPYGIVVTPTNTFQNGKLGLNAQGQTVYEPRNEQKGDAARAQFYEMVCFNNYQNSGNWGYQNLLANGPLQNQTLMKQWSNLDPVDKLEKTRNQYIHTIQNNRNPFIDHPEWIDCINFNNLTQETPCITIVAVNEVSKTSDVKIFPNPASSELNIFSSSSDEKNIRLLSLHGQEILKKSFLNSTLISVTDLQSGMYVLEIKQNNETSQKTILIQH